MPQALQTLTLDDAAGHHALAAKALREQLRAESSPIARLPFMESLLQAFAKVEIPRQSMAALYSFDEGRKQSQRKKDNAAAMQLLAQIDAGEVDANALTTEQKAVLAKYSGTGGGMVGADGKKGSAFEYYTPLPVAQGMWEALKGLGFSGGKVLDPCGGTGIFGAAAPVSVAMDVVELNETSGRVNQLVNGGAGYSVEISPFERVAANTPDDEYDAVITNVPFGTTADRGGNQHLDPKYQKEPLESYFIRRSIEKLKPGGIAAFITPPRCVSGKDGTEKRLRRDVAYQAEFLGAFRLPNSVFGTAAADTMTDVIFFRKFGKDTAERIEELRDQSPELLEQAGVLWDEYLDGDYFRGEGRKFVLGEMTKGMGRFGEVDVLVSNATVGEIGQMLHKLPKSRIDWSLLNSAETLPVVYNEGDTIYQRGQLLTMQSGQWVAQGRKSEQDDSVSILLGKVSTPYAAFEAKVKLHDMVEGAIQIDKTGRSLDMPLWLSKVLSDLVKNPHDEREAIWEACIVGLAAEQVMDERAKDDEPVNFLVDYAALSAAMKVQSTAAGKASSTKGDNLKKAMRVITTQYSKKTGFSAFWRGDIERSTPALASVSMDHGFEGLRYKLKSMSVPVSLAKEVLGDQFDPMAGDDYCISGDGLHITPASDYYSGSYADFLRRIDAEISSATDEVVKNKLLRQKLLAAERLNIVDVEQLEFNLFSPHVTAEEKAEFLRRFVHPESVVVYDEATGKARPDIQISKAGKYRDLSDEEKLKNRIGDYLKNGTITIGTAELGMSKAEALETLGRMVRTANEQFSAWVRSNAAIKSRLIDAANDPERLRFAHEDIEAPLHIEGWGTAIDLHGYQNAYVRQQAREFGGGNGFDVGLGKTATALAAVQYVQSIGVKKKTVFIVPGSVLSNWRKESIKAYAATDDCLYVGLRHEGDGQFTVDSSRFDVDLNQIRENRHSKIYMTFEAFERLRLREQTIDAFGQYMRSVDASFAETQDKRSDERKKGKLAGFKAILSDKTGSAPYLEDLGVDSLVIDEGHAFKNSSETSEFKGGRYLSNAPSSQRGMDMQAKAWYIRGLSPRADGVLVLTASPITNSPLEIFSMLALAVGHKRVNDMLLGVRGADNFMQMMCQIDTERDVTMDGIERESNVFTGLNNVALLRKVVGSVFTIKTAEQVGKAIVVPSKVEHAQPLVMPVEINDRLTLYKEAFRFAIDTLSEKGSPRGSERAYKEVAAHFGEPMELIGHPFNLINKMTMLVLDPELDQRASFYSVPASKADQLAQLVDKFNAKKLTEKRDRLAPNTPEDAVIARKSLKDENGGTTQELTVHVRAVLVQKNRVKLDTIDPKSQTEFEAMAEKMGLDLDVTISPKLAAMLDNYKKERANPRGMDSQGQKFKTVKQIVFCDVLPMHNKIKRILAKRGGTPSSAIAVITGKTNNTAEQILEVQDGFNANGADNKYQAVLANEKAEVGINLQIGTQANHHLTIGWTPDSLQQRNGRSVRQGNYTSQVNVYFYDADGTFDIAKRAMVSRKADWISQVLDPNGGNRVKVSGGMSPEQMEALIEAVGDGAAVDRVQQQAAAKEAARRANGNVERQRINLDSIIKQRQFLSENRDARPMMVRAVLGFRHLLGEEDRISKRVASGTAKNAARLEDLLIDVRARVDSMRKVLDDGLRITKGEGGEAIDIDAYLKAVGTTYMGQQIKNDELSRIVEYGQRGYTLHIVEGGPLHADWEAEVGMAKAMIKEAVRAFESQAKEAGALNVKIAQAFADGHGAYFGSQPVMSGEFLVVDGDAYAIHVVPDGQSQGYAEGVKANSRGGIDRYPLTAFVRGGGQLIRAGDAGYVGLLKSCAALEDELNAEGNPINPYSDVCPQVMDYRTTAVKRKFATHSKGLPAPHFLHVISPDFAKPGSIAEKIFQAQKAVVEGFTEHYAEFVVDGSVEVVSIGRSVLFNSLVAYAVANGLKMHAVDTSTFSPNALANAMNADSAVNLSVALADIASMEGIALDTPYAQFMQQVKEKLLKLAPWAAPDVFDMPDSWFDMFFASSVLGRDSLAKFRARRAIAEKVTQQSETNSLQATKQVTNSVLDSSEFVGVTGNTKPWKEQIKLTAGEGNYRWDGTGEMWNVPRSAWEKLRSAYPSCEMDLRLVAASRKLPSKKS